MIGPLGRADVLDHLDEFIAAARNGLGHAVILRGEPGIGKSVLIESMIESAHGFRILRSDGYEAEADLPYSGVQRLVGSLDVDGTQLPDPEREALRVAFGISAGVVPDRFLVGRAVLGLLAIVGHGGPVLCAVDDAHWLDRESLDVLGFVARRLRAEAAVMVFAARADDEVDVRLGGVSVLPVEELARPAAIELLTYWFDGALDPRVAADIVDEVGGNPLVLTDLARELTARQLADSSFAPAPLGAGSRLEQLYRRALQALPAACREWILVAAAESTGDLKLVDRASALLDIDESAGEAADAAGLVVIDATVRFRHPLVRAAVYGGATAAARRRVHGALARAAQASGSIDIEAWHAAAATARPDASVAQRLADAAERAARRGGLIACASLLARAAELSEDPGLRDERLLAGAESAAAAGAARFAFDLTDRIPDPAVLAPVAAGRRLFVRASLAMFLGDPAAIPLASNQLCAAAELFHGHDSRREHLALLRAFDAAITAERSVARGTFPELGERMRVAAAAAEPGLRAVLTGLCGLILRPCGETAAANRAALRMLAELDDRQVLDFSVAGVVFTSALWDERARNDWLDRVERIAARAGALRELDALLWTRSLTDLDRGDVTAAGRAIARVRELRQAMGYPAEHVVNGAYLAWTGEPTSAVLHIAELNLAAGFGGAHTATMNALAIRNLAQGHYQYAYALLTPYEADRFMQVTPHQLPEYIEAAVRAGHTADAERVTTEFVAFAEDIDSPWARGVAMRCRALLAPAKDAERLYLAAIAALSGTDTPIDLFRAHLLYGEWLRRQRRRADAKVQLRIAAEGFTRFGGSAFAERAARELHAFGERAQVSGAAATAGLTTQESEVAALAAAGNTNAEIAATLFVSANTVDYHLRKVFRKLGISSRRQLREHLPPLSR
ncbi:LuxR C-terminal-related transcriptional regulator [Nocardia sp. PE-7]|uniref:LuxR C-terminal-related transcriptional regulator n=1 Tax=Nocardia sp. PE-7 TaxID=3058426 RepID=UPI00265AB623|nr:helix-turn-helix transcriptional regulator [Nocardia sp. PE-7]WKG12834.1 LuxR C-terminal-related transcriptional regulator [Nocardia sp. PE-7]